MVERIFLGWDEPLLPRAARFLCDRYARDGVVDLKNVVAVLPGSRGGRRLKELLLDEANARGARLIPPRVINTGGLPDLYYFPDVAFADTLVTEQAWSRALRSADPASLRPLFGEPPDPEDVIAWCKLAGMLATVHREVAGGGLTFGDVADVCSASGDLLFDDSSRWSILAVLQAAYRLELGRVGLVDRDLERIDRLARSDLSCASEVILIGVAELTAVARRFVAVTTAPVAALILAPESESAHFDSYGLALTEVWREREIDIPDGVVRVVDRPADQAAMVLSEIGRLGEIRTGDVVIAQTTDALVPYIRERLESAGLPVHYGGGSRIDRSRPFRLLTAIANYLRTREWEDFAALLRHSDMERWLETRPAPAARHGAPDRLDELFSNSLPMRLVAEESPAGDRSRLDAVRRVVDADLLQPLTGPRRALNGWAHLILDYLENVYSAVELSQHSADDRRVAEVLERIAAAALKVQRLPLALAPECDASEAIEVMTRALRSDSVPDEPDGAPIELVGWLELAMDDAPHAIVAGVNEGSLPKSVNADPYLPDSLRTRLGLPNNDVRVARDAFHLQSLLTSRRSVCLIAGRLSETGDPLRPSRLLLATRGERLARRVIGFTSGGHGPSPDSAIVAMSGRHNLFRLPPEPVLTFEPPSRIRVTEFRNVLQDPYTYVLESMLGLASADDQARELDGLRFGTLAHAVLERFGGSLERDSSDARVITARLDALLDEEAARRFGANTFPAVHLQIEQLRERLRSFAVWQAKRAGEGWRIAVVEGSTPDGEGTRLPVMEAPFDVDGEIVILTGRIDRIDHHPAENRWALFDYKTGDRVETPDREHRKQGSWRDLQLPLYRHLVSVLTNVDGTGLIPRGARIDCGYIRLSRSLDEIGGAMAEWTDEDLATADETAREVVRFLRRGTVTFDRDIAAGKRTSAFASLFGQRQLIAAEAADVGDGEGDG